MHVCLKRLCLPVVTAQLVWILANLSSSFYEFLDTTCPELGFKELSITYMCLCVHLTVLQSDLCMKKKGNCENPSHLGQGQRQL